MSVRAFSSAIGATDTNTRNYIDRGSKPNSEYLEKLLKRFDAINPTWLLTGNGEPFLAKPVQTGEPLVNYQKNYYGNSIGANHGTATQNHGLADYERDLGACRAQLELAQKEVESLRAQLTLKDALLSAKEETITLLRGGFSRPN